ncbi:MAG: Sua5/YciO/YrdC/YwlC family protein, partial [Lentisphaeria bacterium]|nr:Sua5/YciO/YrdC/YwlC family protein [Lentisphaeria bacterium]
FVRRLLEECGCVCAATSANRSGTPAAINIQDALAGLDGEPDMAIDGGVITATGGKASTVISLLADTPMVIRTGVISLQQIAEALE